MNLFLDIEGTILKSMDEPVLLEEHVSEIKKAVAEAQNVFIFSFALHNEEDVTKNQIHLDFIKDVIGKEFRIILKDELKPILKQDFPGMDDLDFIDLSKDKESMFIKYVRSKFQEFDEPKFLLIDDMVDDISMLIRKETKIIEIVCLNVSHLKQKKD